MPQPLIVQGDNSILLDVHDDEASEARNSIAPFAELEKSPEHFHTYRISPLSLWNAAAAGLTREEVLERLRRYSRFPLPGNVQHSIGELIGRYGRLRLEPTDEDYTLRLVVPDEDIRQELRSRKNLARYLREEEDFQSHPDSFLLPLLDRGTVKQELIRLGYPVDDRVPLAPGDPLEFSLQEKTRAGAPFLLRDYQKEAARTFHGGGDPGTGYGVVVLPCGAGKTVVGIETMHLLQTNTLILTTNVAAVHQWIDELLDKTTLGEDQIGEYSGTRKDVLPVTVATYQILVWRRDRESPFPHFDIFRRRRWGLIIYDEVHLLPAPIFRVTAEIQAVRRLGLTATLIREDQCETDVFSLVGPKRYDVPWKELEQKGWIAEATCYEIRLDLPRELRTEYAVADKRRKYRLAAENHRKIEAARQIIENHPGEAILVIGQYLEQLKKLAHHLEAPLITGSVPNHRREEIYQDFRQGSLPVIVVSKVANFAIDLPNASVAIQVSGSFGSRQEEAQRLGRILRPSPGEHHNSTFYTLVSNHTVEEEFAANRQKFLAEQGYTYHIEHWTD
ncbi:DNA excision repair protein ERCC-3 [Alkalispirochaeta americana]|uniref:DNA 3'-5' helicase n=1 Tax=Alkalispirochaeta americana TaxID=159291 RepID=A0A1N6TE61_9SPIO|nr:DNA repair helicase XPB [Alkalispirochaeta americana]SIQ51679.1 DNA excision repair protein ERCC-3 [Alkalispirochaeta americana]